MLGTNLQVFNHSVAGASLVRGRGELSSDWEGSAVSSTQEEREPCGSTLLAHSADQKMVISVESFEFLCVCILVGADLSV